MALKIFDTDPEAKAAREKAAEYERRGADSYEVPAFQLRTGMQVWNKAKKKNDPVSLRNWRAVSDDPAVTSALAELYGGTHEEYDQTAKLPYHVLTDTPDIEVVINGSKAIEDKLVQWGGPGGPIHECDGVAFLSPDEDKGQPCGCPETLAERKERAQRNRGPKPAINVTFRLAGKGEDLGVGKAIFTAWSLAEVIHEVKDALDAVDGPALCRLSIEHVEYTTKDGEKREFNKPVITVLGSYNDAIAEER